MRTTKTTVTLAAALALAAALPGARTPANPDAARLDALLKKVQTDPAGTTEQQVRDLLDLAAKLGRPYSASLSIRGFLSHHFRPSPELLRATAQAAYNAGDYTYAVARYKAYLAVAKPTEAAGRAAGRLYALLIDFLGAEEDAYQFMRLHGWRFRSLPPARRYDNWFLARARAKNDSLAVARTLAAALADRLPLEQEKAYYWESLDWLLGAVASASAEHFPALPHCRKIVPRIRGDRRRSLRAALLTANLAFRAAAAGKDEETLRRDFQPVVDAATAYVAAFPTAETLREILHVLAGGPGRFDYEAWNRQRSAKQAFFAAAFGKLADKEKLALLAWAGRTGRTDRLASPQQWAEIGQKNAALFAGNPLAGNIPLPLEGKSRADYARLAAFCRGIPAEDAAVVSALAAGDSLQAVLDALVKNDAWHLRLDRYDDIILHKLIPAWRAMHEKPGKPLARDVLDKALIEFGRQHLARSPIAVYCPELAREYLAAAWRSGGKDRWDKAHIPGVLRSLSWAPVESGYRRRHDALLGGLSNDVRQWAEEVRRDARRKGSDRRIDPAVARQIAPVQEALQQARLAPDPTRAPDPLCRAVAEMALAARKRDETARIDAERRIYALVRNYDTDHRPFGGDLFGRIISSRGRQMNNLDFQLEMLADQLKRFAPGRPAEPLERLMAAIFSDRGDWSLGGCSSRHRAACLRVNAVLAEAVGRLADRGQFDARLFDWFLQTRRGRSWSEEKAGADVFAKIIEKRLFHASGYRVAGARSATVSYMRLVRSDFPTLNKRFPVETWFDDMFVEEATATGFLDYGYWDLGRDEKGKVVAAAARLLAADRLPIGPEDAEGVYSVRTLNRWINVALRAGPAARKKLLAAAEAAWGKTRFDTYAMGYGYFSGPGAAEAAGRETFFRRLDAYLRRSAEAPARLSVPALALLEKIDAADLTDAELGILVRVFTDAPSPYWPRGMQFDRAIELILDALEARKRRAEIFGLLGPFWKAARDMGDYRVWRSLVARADRLRKAREVDLALAHANVGLALLGERLNGDFRNTLTSVRTWALAQMGGIIPVPKGHPLRPLYEAQLAYLTGKQQTAWETYLANRARLLKSYREFDPQFCIWVIHRETEFRNFDAAEALAREMITWFDEVSERFDAEVRARLQLAYADIALARDDRPRARALYERIAANAAFAGTRAQLDAELKTADVDARDGNFDRAVERLEELASRQDRYLQTEAAYHLALVRYAQEEYAEAREHLARLFSLRPDHAEGRILEGRVNLKLKKLEQPTDIDLGERIGKKFIVPGRPVRVTLVDQNLSIVRKATEIEIRAWTDSGDEEFFVLTPFGDSKVKFKGQVPTELGAVRKHDHVIQVIGRDRVHYAFSEDFARAQKIETNEPFTLDVATDAELYVSSGKILTREQREAIALEQMIRKRMELEEPEPEKAAPLSAVRAADQIKPGNPINIRVVDPDRGETRGRDSLTVRVSTTSGDSIAAFTLTETDDHSGVFEGSVPTEPAQATAVASDSQEGAEANFAISSKDYPAWVGLPRPIRSRPKTFSVDLNDNVSLGKMRILAAEQGRRLKSFLVQTSFNGRDFTTVGAWPKPYEPWSGRADVEFVRYVAADGASRGRLTGPRTLAEFREYLQQGYIREGLRKVSRPLGTLAARWDWKLDGAGREIGLDSSRSSTKYFLAHMRAAFYQPRRQIRTFLLRPRLAENARSAGATYLLAIDGETSSDYQAVPRDEPFAVGIKRALGKGVHRIDVYVFAHQHAPVEFEVACDTDKPPYLVPCPAEMFDPAKHPEIPSALARQIAKVQADADNTAFDVAFPPGTRARVVRLLLTDFESDAPAINKIHLTDADGRQVLPTRHDFLTLRKNQVLEIVPGDRITVTYEDPKVLTAGKELHEAFLTATYTNATISACFVEYTMRSDGERDARYIPMRRFGEGDKINVFINDPDGDVSEKLDTLTFTARTTDGKPVTLTALETAEHSGVFLGAVFPVRGEPKRKSELTVREGDDVILSYLDRENTDPGIPWQRTATVEQVWFTPPQVRLYEVSSLTLEQADRLAGRKAPAAGRKRRAGRGAEPAEPSAIGEVVPPRRTLLAVRPEPPEQTRPANVVIGGPLLVEVLFPFITKSAESVCSIYVQTSSGRKKFGRPLPEDAFDPNVPGTLLLSRTPGDAGAPPAPPGYREVIVRANPYALDALDDGRFTFSVPVQLGAVPGKTLVDISPEQVADEAAEPLALAVNARDTIYVGLRFTDRDGKPRWLVRKAALSADVFFDAMDRRYQEEVTGLYVGQNVYFRVIDPAADRTDEKDVVRLQVAGKAGRPKAVDLVETFSHSGVFKGLAKVVHAEDAAAASPGAVPAVYGDLLTARYTREGTDLSAERTVAVFKGADGVVVPFTKRFKDPDIAVETQFMIAEAYFELAKRHRQLGQEKLARDEIARGRKLLQEAIHDYPNTSARAQAEYLLADLSLEFGNDANDPAVRKKHYMDAIARYSDIVATWPDSEYAPKAQFRKALAFEKMEMLDEACEEYVKLSYRYPDNPLVAETIARLGQYFLNKGRAITAEAEKLKDPVEQEKKRLGAVEMFRTAGEVFARLGERFPTHKLAGKTLLLSAQCFMQAKDYNTAIAGYERLIKTPDMDKDLVAEAMYWCGHSYMEINDLVKAYQSFKKLTWDYPASKWAKFARGRLADEALQKIEE